MGPLSLPQPCNGLPDVEAGKQDKSEGSGTHSRQDSTLPENQELGRPPSPNRPPPPPISSSSSGLNALTLPLVLQVSQLAVLLLCAFLLQKALVYPASPDPDSADSWPQGLCHLSAETCRPWCESVPSLTSPSITATQEPEEAGKEASPEGGGSFALGSKVAAQQGVQADKVVPSRAEEDDAISLHKDKPVVPHQTTENTELSASQADKTGSIPALSHEADVTPSRADEADVTTRETAGAEQGSPFQFQEFKSCELLMLGGSPTDQRGAWPVCINHLPPRGTVYSFGVGGDASSELALLKRGHRVFGFDPDMEPESAPDLLGQVSVEVLQRFTFMQAGLGAANGEKGQQGHARTATVNSDTEAPLVAPVLTLQAVMAELKHDHVDLLKVDVRGVEGSICSSGEFLSALPRVGQLVLRWHTPPSTLEMGGVSSQGDIPKTQADTEGKGEGEGERERCFGAVGERGLRHVQSTGTGEHVFARVSPHARVDRPKAAFR